MISKSKIFKNFDSGQILRIVTGIIMLALIAEPAAADLFSDIETGEDHYYVGDTIVGSVYVANYDDFVRTNVKVSVYGSGLDVSPHNIELNFEDLNPGESKGIGVELIAAGESYGDLCTMVDSNEGPGVGWCGPRGIEILPKPLPVPEFPTVVMPIVAIIGLMFLLQRRKGK